MITEQSINEGINTKLAELKDAGLITGFDFERAMNDAELKSKRETPFAVVRNEFEVEYENADITNVDSEITVSKEILIYFGKLTDKGNISQLDTTVQLVANLRDLDIGGTPVEVSGVSNSATDDGDLFSTLILSVPIKYGRMNI